LAADAVEEHFSGRELVYQRDDDALVICFAEDEDSPRVGVKTRFDGGGKLAPDDPSRRQAASGP
jgi:hypothetical protein